MADTYTYDAFGNVRTQTGSSGNEFTFTGGGRGRMSGLAVGRS